MQNLNFELKQLTYRNRDGAYSTQAERRQNLQNIAADLLTLGYQRMQATSLKPKHVESLVGHWKTKNLAIGTVKNRMAALRWWAEKVGKQNVVRRTNAEYGIGKRSFVANQSKAIELTPGQLDQITDPYTKLSLRLQQAFGLRREESIKFKPSFADRGDRIVLKKSWTKGGREREVVIRTLEQRALIDEIRAFVGNRSLIPAKSNYKNQLQVFKYQTEKAGIYHVHGLRHHYAQQRYEELTGWKAPALGGPKSKELTPLQKEADRAARLLISQELGHKREQITTVYLGR